jgi:hypothetical protein
MSQQNGAEQFTAGVPNNSDSPQVPNASQSFTSQQPSVSKQPQGPLRGTFSVNSVQEDRRLARAMAHATRDYDASFQHLSAEYDKFTFRQQVEHARLLHRTPPGPHDDFFAVNHRDYAEVAWNSYNHWAALLFKTDDLPEFKAVTGHEPVLWFRKSSSSSSSPTCLEDHNPIGLNLQAECILMLTPVIDRYTPSRALREQPLAETQSYACADIGSVDWGSEDEDGGAPTGNSGKSENKDEERDTEMVDSVMESLESEEEEQDEDERALMPMPMHMQRGKRGKK